MSDERIEALRARARAKIEADPVGALTNVVTGLVAMEVEEIRDHVRDLDDALERVTLDHAPDCAGGVAFNECACGLARVHELRAELRRAVGGGA